MGGVRRWKTIGSLGLAAGALAACGGTSATDEGAPATGLAPPATEAPPVETTPAPETDPPAPPTTELIDTAETAPADEPPSTEPELTTTVAPTTTVPIAEVGGRAFDEAVAPESEVETNPLPDLVVDDVARGAKANLRNVFPADRPVLFWMYAPH
jgi:hypothetical protein